MDKLKDEEGKNHATGRIARILFRGSDSFCCLCHQITLNSGKLLHANEGKWNIGVHMMCIIVIQVAGGSPQHRGQAVDAKCSRIRGGPVRTRLRLVKSTAGRALHCTFLQWLNFGLDFLPQCCQATMLLQRWNLFYPCSKSWERSCMLMRW